MDYRYENALLSMALFFANDLFCKCGADCTKRLTGMYEKDLYNNICSSAVLNQDLHSLLLEKSVCENKSSDSSLFVTIVPRRFGLCATNEAFVTKMRLYLNIFH
ncbi:hypothetical protein P9112_003667 [Eukaryota sp. TZLM1-RC]